MATDIEICNLALDNLGVTNKVTDIAAPTTKEEKACARWYATARDSVLRDLPWPFASRCAEMVEDETETHPQWPVVHTAPEDMLKPRIVFPENDRQYMPPIPFASFLDSTKLRWMIGCDQPGLWLEYTMKFDTNALVAMIPADVVDALAWFLAARLVTPLALDKTLIKDANAMYITMRDRAYASDLASVRFDPQPEADWITERG